VTGDSIVALAREVPGLRRLALLNCEISDEHLVALASVLTRLHTLQARVPTPRLRCAAPACISHSGSLLLAVTMYV